MEGSHLEIDEAPERPDAYRVLAIPDLQVPYHAARTLLSVLEYARGQWWDEVVLMGDFMDFDCISSFNKGKPRTFSDKTLERDYGVGNEVLDAIQAAVTEQNDDCKIVFLEGNHEYRIERLLDEQPQLQGLLEVPTQLRLRDRGVVWVPCYTEGTLYRIGRAYFHHGLYTNKYHARSMVESFGVNIFYGHVHDVQSHAMQRWGRHSTVIGQSLGCLCNYDLDYVKRRPTNWQHAFAEFWFKPNGDFQYTVTQIFRGQFYAPDGKLYGRGAKAGYAGAPSSGPCGEAKREEAF